MTPTVVRLGYGERIAHSWRRLVRLIWVRWARPRHDDAPTSSHKGRAGTTAGKSFPTGPKRGRKAVLAELHLVDEDTMTFNRIMAVFAMPKSTDEEAARERPCSEATLYATGFR